MSPMCQVQEQNDQPTVVIRVRTRVGDLPGVLGKAYPKLFGYLAEVGQQPVGPPYVAYFNCDMDDLDVEVGVPVAGEVAGKGDIAAGVIPGGTVVTCLHIGPYDQIEKTYRDMMQWVTEHGYEPEGLCREAYLNAPGEVPPEQLRTLVVMPLKA